mgnify:CR=1 FL=1|jgi:hypothetical protein
MVSDTRTVSSTLASVEEKEVETTPKPTPPGRSVPSSGVSKGSRRRGLAPGDDAALLLLLQRRAGTRRTTLPGDTNRNEERPEMEMTSPR